MRDQSNIVDIIATAQRDLEELKAKQFFGADALKINRWSKEITTTATSISYRLKLIPKTKSAVLPMQPTLKWKYNGTYGASMTDFLILQEYTTDGSFQWKITGGRQNSDLSNTTVSLGWIGDATVDWRQI